MIEVDSFENVVSIRVKVACDSRGRFPLNIQNGSGTAVGEYRTRHELGVLRRSAPKRLKITRSDRLFWIWLRRLWSEWKAVLVIVKPETVVAWHRKGFRFFWSWKIRLGNPDAQPSPSKFEP